MKNYWPSFTLSVFLVSVLTPVMAQTDDTPNDVASQREHRRAELRSALSAPVPRTGTTEKSSNKAIFQEHQLSAQERADLRRQLREQFRSIGFNSPP